MTATRTQTGDEQRRTLILTGASRGIGHATVKRFASAGWRVITCSRHAFPENCPWAAGPEDHIQVDLGNARDTLRAVREMRERLDDGKLHALVNNAGMIEELTSAKGAIVNVTSIAGGRVHPFAGAAYATSKAALAALTREMAADFGPLGIRVNAIAPGEIDTAILSPGTEKIVESIPLQRLGAPEEVANAIYYLCTEQSSYVTGAELHINGGQHV
jgi:NAD(P)-dependent dehydrogenase (short-subunit alcohol dehydrogenase family)